MKRTVTIRLSVLAVLLACAMPFAFTQASENTGPGANWETVNRESISYSSLRLDALTALLKAEHTTAMLVVVHGKVIFQYGDVSYVSQIASARKSVLSMLYGNYVESGKIDLQKTVKDIGLTDVHPFLPIEERATLEQLLAGRSGIYIATDKPGPLGPESFQPSRGSQLPGNYFTYNEWDFNAAGTAFEKLTGKISTTLSNPISPVPSACRISTAPVR
jgi:CubicO group peptidase (beta-lactamase class C family)